MHEPGSTFKIVVISAALNEGLVAPSDVFFCENGRWMFKGRPLHDHDHGYGNLTVEGIITKSSNIGAAKIAVYHLGEEKLHDYMTRFGFGQPTGITLDGEIRGWVKPWRKWDGLAVSRIPMGHAITTTPLQMAMAMSAIANEGRLMRPLVKQGVYVNPTLYLIWGGSTERWRDWTAAAAPLAKGPDLAFVPASAKAAWTRQPRPRAGYDKAAEFLRKYSEAGGKILAATDTGCCEQIVPGLSLHYEMQMLTDLGVSPMKAIQGATLWAAEVLGREKDLGSVEPGKFADFTVIEGNPLADISATKNVRMVIKNGEVMDTAYDPKWVNPVPRTPATPR